MEGPGKWSAPGPALALGGPACKLQIEITYSVDERYIRYGRTDVTLEAGHKLEHFLIIVHRAYSSFRIR